MQNEKIDTVDKEEINRFAALANNWWDPNGSFRPLHQINPVRLQYIKSRLCSHFSRDPSSRSPLKELRLLDIGCGGGLLSEPMARLGASVVGADASEDSIQIARLHAEESNLSIDYVHTTAEQLVDWGENFDVILNMEVIEHVADVSGFVNSCAALLNPNGAMVIATLNRTLKSWVLGVVGAEFLLRWLPRGTHDWKKFLRPSELGELVRSAGLTVADFTGIQYSILTNEWRSTDDLSINYLSFTTKR